MDMLIHLEGDVYSVEHFGREGSRIRALFGTTVLPTPYRSLTPARVVLQTIRMLNPGMEVCLHPDLLPQ